MSLYGMMRTGVSGMNAQANRLSTVADNIANSGTTGYKRSSRRILVAGHADHRRQLQFRRRHHHDPLCDIAAGRCSNTPPRSPIWRSTATASSSSRIPSGNAVPDTRRRLRARRRGPAGQCRRLLADGLQLCQRHAERRHQRLRRAGAGR